jgi:cell division protein FtsZ
MQGAKGVIISIIGGEDMKLLEVDEAANHIRELVDPEANIIWGSAFNPDLDGKIRVSVVATGIEQTSEMAERASQPLNFGASRGPKRPVLPLPTDEELAEEAATTNGDTGYAEPAGQEAPAEPPAFEPQAYEPEPYAPEEETAPAMPSGMAEPAQDTHQPTIGGGFGRPEHESAQGQEDDGWDEAPQPAVPGGNAGDPDTLELSLDEEAPVDFGTAPHAPAGDDEDRRADAIRRAESPEPLSPLLPKKRRGLVSGGEGGGPALGAGSTLFERMANLSRGGPRGEAEEEEEGEEEDDGSALNIPRFLGRQNNQ